MGQVSVAVCKSKHLSADFLLLLFCIFSSVCTKSLFARFFHLNVEIALRPSFDVTIFRTLAADTIVSYIIRDIRDLISDEQKNVANTLFIGKYDGGKNYNQLPSNLKFTK